MQFVHAQSDSLGKNNTVSLEVGKSGLILNMSYDKRINKNWGYRFIVGSNFSNSIRVISFGGGGFYLTGKNRHWFELGMDLQYIIANEISDDQRGFSFVYPDYTVHTFYPSLNIGYRNYGKKLMFRIGASPGIIDGNFFADAGYIGLGFRF